VSFLEPEQIEFCQARPLRRGESLIMGKDWIRALQRLMQPIQKFDSKLRMLSYYRSVCWCCGTIYKNVPILGPFYKDMYDSITSLGVSLKVYNEDIPYVYRMSRHGQSLPFTSFDVDIWDDTRHSFERAYGVTVGEQFLVEQALKDLVLALLRASF
jgi:hypothetical protein